MKTKIIVCCHKKAVLPVCEDYFPIHVGKALHPDIDLKILAENKGENISEKNESYCELTGMYWIWKHLTDVDVIGLCHYRRYFKFVSCPQLYRPLVQSSFSKLQSECSPPPKHIINSITNGMVVTAKAEKWSVPVYTHYCEWHYCDDMLALYKVVKKTQPENYVKAFKKVIFCSNSFSPYNMFIMSRTEYDKYCSWLFPLLKEVEKETDISSYNRMQRRVYGYLSERLLDVYILANKLKRKQFPIIYFEEEENNKSKWLFYLDNMRFILVSAIRYICFVINLKVGHLRNAYNE